MSRPLYLWRILKTLSEVISIFPSQLVQIVKNNWDLSKLFKSVSIDFIFEMGHGICNDWVDHQINSFWGFPLSELVKTSQQLIDYKIFMVFQVNKDFVSSHRFVVDEVVNLDRCVIFKRTRLYDFLSRLRKLLFLEECHRF